MKVLFLDHFGVMCLAGKHGKESKWDELPRFNEMRVHGKFDNFDREAVKILNSILENNIEIIVSSDWKRWCNIEEMGTFYLSQGINKQPLSFTPKSEFIKNNFRNANDNKFILQHQRAYEISAWLKEHPEVTNWVAVDDLYLGEPHLKNWGLRNFVWVSKSDEGIRQAGIKEKILYFLNL